PVSFSPSPLHLSGSHRALLSFPTRRSSDLGAVSRSGPWQQHVVDDPAHRHDRDARPRAACLWERTAHGPVSDLPEAMMRALFVVDRKSTRLNSSHVSISYAVFCLKKKMPQT